MKNILAIVDTNEVSDIFVNQLIKEAVDGASEILLYKVRNPLDFTGYNSLSAVEEMNEDFIAQIDKLSIINKILTQRGLKSTFEYEVGSQKRLTNAKTKSLAPHLVMRSSEHLSA